MDDVFNHTHSIWERKKNIKTKESCSEARNERKMLPMILWIHYKFARFHSFLCVACACFFSFFFSSFNTHSFIYVYDDDGEEEKTELKKKDEWLLSHTKQQQQQSNDALLLPFSLMLSWVERGWKTIFSHTI
jgi:hypothetical protein